jgi:predicted AlkP superfamily phosphohydrolase/phosphomutase
VWISQSNPSFTDGVPILLILLSLFPASALFLVGWAVGRFLAPNHRVRLFSWTLIHWLGNRKTFVAILISVFFIYFTLFIIAAQHNRRLNDSHSPSLLIIGLDGATWDILDPWMNAGIVTNLQKLCATGMRGPLRSLEPMRSPSLWTSIAAGVSPETHGITGFLSTKADLQSKRIWDVCVENDISVGLYSWLLSWPPEPYFQFVIPSWMAKTPETYPSRYACVQELNLEQDRFGGAVHPFRSLWQCAHLGAQLRGMERLMGFYLYDKTGLSEEERFAHKILAEVRLQTDLFLALQRRHSPDVATFTLYGTDKLAHRFWREMAPDDFPELEPTSSQFADVIKNYYREADRAIGRILDRLNPAANIVVLSDHGMKADTALPRQFFLDIQKLLKTLRVDRSFHYSTVLRQVILEPDNINQNEIPALVKRMESIHFKGEEYPVFTVEVNENGQITLQTNFSLSWNPDSPILTCEQILIDGKSFPTSRFFFSRTFSGCHELDGILILNGPAFKNDGRVANVGLLDIAPTLLYLLDLPISRELEGNILSEAFTERFLENHTPRYVDQYAPFEPLKMEMEIDDENLKERLRRLGYI